MIDFYNEINKYVKLQEPKDLRDMIGKDKKDFIDLAISIIYKNEKHHRYSGDR